jgi:hypothetical protein
VKQTADVVNALAALAWPILAGSSSGGRCRPSGIAALTGGEAVDAAISDLAHDEPAGYQPDTGLDLIRKVRDLRIDTPIFPYASQRGVRMRDTIVASGGNGVAASTRDLFALPRGIGVVLRPGAA